MSSVKEFAGLSEQELDRIETLVQSLLKITRLDAGAIVLEKNAENVADMMRDIELHLHIEPDRKERNHSVWLGSSFSFCDRDWLNEAIDNIVKMRLTIQKVVQQFVLRGRSCRLVSKL